MTMLVLFTAAGMILGIAIGFIIGCEVTIRVSFRRLKRVLPTETWRQVMSAVNEDLRKRGVWVE